MSDEIEYKLGSVADAFSDTVKKRIENEQIESIELAAAINILTEELFHALRILENSISK